MGSTDIFEEKSTVVSIGEGPNKGSNSTTRSQPSRDPRPKQLVSAPSTRGGPV